MRPHISESPLLRSPDKWLCCSTCWYHERNMCKRRERLARWDPNKFVCGDYGTKDEEPEGNLLDYGVWIE